MMLTRSLPLALTLVCLPALTVAAAADPRVISAGVLGEVDKDLVFVPVAPCRIIDTRLGGGVLAANTNRDFEVSGTLNFAAQGGNAGGCGIPQGAGLPLAPAVAINFIAVGPLGPGNLRAWEFNQPMPAASVINYANVAGLNIANGVIVPIASDSALDKDMTVRADASGTHVVADVTGYFTRATVTQLVQSSSTTDTDIGDGLCKQLLTCAITTTVASIVMVDGSVQVGLSHAAATIDSAFVNVETVTPPICPQTGPNFEAAVVASALPSSFYSESIPIHRVFTQAAGVTVTYRLSLQMTSGAGAGDTLFGARLDCVQMPD